MSDIATVATLMRKSREAGICLYLDTNGKIYGLPGEVVRRNRPLMVRCGAHAEGIKKWLQIVGSLGPTSPAT